MQWQNEFIQYADPDISCQTNWPIVVADASEGHDVFHPPFH
jgi:hypothetical protein